MTRGKPYRPGRVSEAKGVVFGAFRSGRVLQSCRRWRLDVFAMTGAKTGAHETTTRPIWLEQAS
jgi:hypothetical protein